MWHNILNSIPVVGHAKGMYHYMRGDIEAGNRAMKESTRSTTVMGAGALGCIAGPVGAAGLAATTGALWDTVESIATDKPCGIVSGVGNIIDTTSGGKAPVGGILQATLSVGGDMVGGLGGGSIVNSASQALSKSAATTAGKTIGESVGKSLGKSAGETILKSASVGAGETFGRSVAQSVGKTMAKEVTKTVIIQEAETVMIYGTTRAVVKETEKVLQESPFLSQVPVRSNPPQKPPKSNSSQKPPKSNPSQKPPSSGQPTPSNPPEKHQSSGPSSSGSGQQPPRKNPTNNNCGTSQQPQESPWEEFLSIFEVKSLDEISIRGQKIFKNLSTAQKKYLENIIKTLKKKGILKKTIETMVNIFNTVGSEDVTFVNFLSLAEIILQHVGELMARRNELDRIRQDSPDSYLQRRDEIAKIVGIEILPHDYTIVRVFQEIKSQIELCNLPINFRDIFAAVYHYYKHRRVGDVELSVQEYYDLIKSHLETIMNTEEFKNLKSGGKIKFEKYYKVHGTRLLIVIKKQGVCVTLCTCFFFDDYVPTDGEKDGDMYINGKRLEPDDYQKR